MRKVIVTGANGFIGSALCKVLARDGISVIAVVRNKNSKIDSIKGLPGIKIVYCELATIKKLFDYINDRDIDAFFHLAWEGGAGGLRGNRKIQLNNIQYTCDAVEICSELGCSRFIFPSSIMEYEIQALMGTEAIPGINTLYSSAKIAADYMARTVAGSLGIEYIRALVSNVYGPGEKSERLINTSLRKMIKGEHCAFSPGEQLYDFIYISDAAEEFAEIGKKGINNKTYYIGSQNPKPLKEFLLAMRNAIDESIEIGIGEIPFQGVSLSYKEFDLYAVERDTGYVPRVSFVEGIKKTFSWIKEMG